MVLMSAAAGVIVGVGNIVGAVVGNGVGPAVGVCVGAVVGVTQRSGFRRRLQSSYMQT